MFLEILVPVSIAPTFGVVFVPFVTSENNLEMFLVCQVCFLYFVFGFLMYSIQHPGCWWKHLLQATIKSCSWMLSACSGLCYVVVPYMIVCQVSIDFGLALVSPLASLFAIMY